MDDVILRISRHYLTGVVGILGLGAASYLIKRYLSNTEHTTNAYYTRMDELAHGANIAALATSSRKVFIFWNGDFNSTYLLLDYLQQDYIIQPLYIERYTIRKALEHDLLEKYTSQYNQSKLSPSNAKCPPAVLEYLADVAKMKRQQTLEITQMTTLRRVITRQYPEFQANLLPTQYITVIEKDLAYSQNFYDALRALDLPSLEYAGIELYEQAARYFAHLPMDKSNSNQKVMIGYSLDSHLTPIIQKIENNLTLSRNKIDLPLAKIPNADIKYLAAAKFNKEVVRFLAS